ncbi:MAG: tol-pal system protein YbgF [Proteobacteria bacterium]|nr:tol-pal system protein YbgF [Pseudomonadota bacterium]
MYGLAARALLFVGLAALAVLPVTGAQAQQGRDTAIAQRLNDIERTLQDLQRAVYRGEAPPARTGGEQQPVPAAGIAPEVLSQRLVSNEQRMADIEAELRGLTGAIENAVHAVDLMRSRVDKLVADVDFRLTALERAVEPGAQDQSAASLPGERGVARAAEAPRTEPQQQAAVVPAQSLPDGTPAQQYEHALSLLMTSVEYDTAEQAFKAFLANNAAHPLAANAQYWLGESYYVRKNYAEAAAAFIEGYTRYPEGSKAPDNLLKLGMSLAALDNKDDACASLKELDTRFPAADPRLLQQSTQQKEKLGCP